MKFNFPVISSTIKRFFSPPLIDQETVSFELNGQSIDALHGETILQAADRVGINDIPRLCYKKGYRSDGNCRSCVVEVEGFFSFTLKLACFDQNWSKFVYFGPKNG